MAKAGILEIADVFVVNKADRDGAGEVVRELRQMLHLGAARPWDPPILQTSALGHEGIAELRSAIAGPSDVPERFGLACRRSGGPGSCARSRAWRPPVSV